MSDSQPLWLTRERLFAGGAVLAVAGLSLVVVLLGGLSRPGADPPSDPGTPAEPVIPAPSQDAVVLFHVAENGLSLVAHEQSVPPSAGADPVARARLVADLQLGPAPSPMVSPFPEGTQVRAIYITPTGDAFVDLSLEVSRGHPGGSLDELFTVYSLVNALTTNVPEIVAVQILVEGREVDTLAGHVDLRRPLERNLKWVAGRTPEQTRDTGNTAGTGTARLLDGLRRSFARTPRHDPRIRLGF